MTVSEGQCLLAVAGYFLGELRNGNFNPEAISGRDLQFSALRRGAADIGEIGPYLVGRGKMTATGSTGNRIIFQSMSNQWLSCDGRKQPKREFHRMVRPDFARISSKLPQGKIAAVPKLATITRKTFELSACSTVNRGRTMTQRRQNLNFRLDQGRN